ncbi:hypothetical protein BAE44_0009253 [Dichanthelium oligosanthes]|uniref:Uncharacterized protein n=1 Tax=Dichanthelium oligosanthes TaxID=888268 RepID=A0A1E5VX85_9POAL|nr:hypothetical protein BAE44_0009253 [Dichanthelium oligosanthes]
MGARRDLLFRVYEAADFGFGQPLRLELVSMSRRIMFRGGWPDGEVQFSVALDRRRTWTHAIAASGV